MSKEIFQNKAGIAAKIVLVNIILIVNVFVWYFYAFTILKEIIEGLELTYFENLILWATNFIGAATSALVGASLTNKLGRRISFILFWILIGVVFSLIPILVNITTIIGALIVSLLFGVSFGLGMPACMGYFTECTTTENRARLGGILFFITGLGTFSLGMASVSDFVTRILILAAWRGLGLIAFFFIKQSERLNEVSKKVSYGSILTQRSFMLYFIPWIMLCLVNYSTIPVTIKFFNENLVHFSEVVESALIGGFAVIGGFISDIVGRKRVAIVGFVMIGLGYAALGIYPGNLSWYFYTVVDGIAWGIFFTIFLMTLWGDLAYGAPSEKYYALGGLPFLLSNFVQIIVGSYIAETISIYTVFSLASFFLFLAVLPLMYAPETLPEKKIRERELKGYIDKAKKTREKYT
jgi:MFS family permease